MSPDTLINRVDSSSLVTIKLEEFFPSDPIVTFDLKDFLFHGLILKELDFRNALKEFNWETCRDAYVCIYCSTDAIIPTWAYMLAASYASNVAREIWYGNRDEFLRGFFRKKIYSIDPLQYKDAKLVIKGCSDKEVPPSAYLDITACLKPVAASIMYGEPCSTVPVYKKPKA